MNDSLETLLADGIIDAVIGQLKTGKEAEVWLVQHAGQVVAAKLYKERHERNFRNNSGYKEGREVRNSRTRRAMEKGSRFGQAAAEEAWKNAEADSLYKLHAQGVRVPTPVLFYEGILLMELVLDEQGQPAPRLVEAPPLTPEDAEACYLDLRGQVIRTLCADLIHGDLSPYNILMSGMGPTLIDFPQTVAAARNSQAEFYFRRDLDNVREFLTGISHRLASRAGDTGEIWNAYVRRDLTPEYTPSGNFKEAPRRNGAQGRPGPRAERFGQEGRGDFRAAPAPEAAPVELEEGVSAEEAELRALEALVLRQGGGERGRPVVTSSPRDGRRRGGFGGKPPPRTGNAPRPGGNAGPQQGAAARPQQGGNNRPGGNNGRPQQGGPRGGAPVVQAAPAAAGDARTNGRPQQQGGGPRNGNPRGGPNEPRRDGRPPRQPNGDQRVNGAPSQPHGDARANGAPSQQGEPRMNGRPQQNGEPRANGSQQNGEARMNGRPQQNGEPRTHGRPQQNGEARANGSQQNGEPRMNGRSQNGEARMNGSQQNGEPRMNGRSQNGGEARANGSQQRGEPRMNGRPQNGEARANGAQQNGEPRTNGRAQNGDARMNGSQQNGEPRMNGAPSQARDDARANGRSHGDNGFRTDGQPSQHGEARMNGRPQQQNGEPRSNGRPPRGQRPPNTEGDNASFSPPSKDVPSAEGRAQNPDNRRQRSRSGEAPAMNAEPRQEAAQHPNDRGPDANAREARGNPARMPRQPQERGTGRPARGASPQVSYVGRSPASASSNRGPETGSSSSS
ncbi:hypothetical protein D7X74_29550 [Corallococcus sp. CA047B]|uniref:RIO1 family regulatory kinase/ATPase domain-containing protein n=1 Tax=Corallococcus sp. CA047B TaxID=2316729 RepID=UPI000EA03F7B|nr:RIO1 family regulatory kinase/ATPase [Corallococcus sp. CA047B]RKH09441.1 hypothetical protein D7X74_29550 [Corallococcus sp. CA047B]